MNTKSKDLTAFILSILFMIGCEKDPAPLNGVIEGVARGKWTNQPLDSIMIKLVGIKEDPYDDSHINWSFNPLDTTFTTDNGRFTFHYIDRGKYIRLRLISNIAYTPRDSTKTPWKYDLEQHHALLVDGNLPLTQEHTIRLRPSGFTEVLLTDSMWNEINSDSVVFVHPYAKDTLVNRIKQAYSEQQESRRVLYWFPPSQKHQFSWSYIKDGALNAKQTKVIYIVNSHTSKRDNKIIINF